MSTITREFTKEQLISAAKARMEFAEMMMTKDLLPLQIRNWSIEAELARIALASLEAEAVHQVLTGDAWVDLSKGAADSQKRVGAIVRTLYTSPPAPVSVPDLKPVGFLFVSDDGAVAYSPADWPMKGFNLIGQIYGDLNACRAAMLQGAEPVMTAYKLRDAVDAIRNSGIAIDGEKILAERDALNSPVIPYCWCRTCRPVTIADMRFVVCPDCGNKRCPKANDHRNECTGSNEPGQQGSAYPAVPNRR